MTFSGALGANHEDRTEGRIAVGVVIDFGARLHFQRQMAHVADDADHGLPGRSSTASTTLKMAVFAPMPSASVSTAINVKPGCLSNIRAP
jgi:hypothetical protein